MGLFEKSKNLGTSILNSSQFIPIPHVLPDSQLHIFPNKKVGCRVWVLVHVQSSGIFYMFVVFLYQTECICTQSINLPGKKIFFWKKFGLKKLGRKGTNGIQLWYYLERHRALQVMFYCRGWNIWRCLQIFYQYFDRWRYCLLTSVTSYIRETNHF
jgi:hypothetical protein